MPAASPAPVQPPKAPKGTRDILPGDIETWQRVEAESRELFALYGYAEIRTPLFESTDLFRKSTGELTDIVTKEMYTFSDRAGRSLTLRPEGTPGVVRAALEHRLLRRGDLERLCYLGPMFRYERPQKGRYRQFAQIGVEAFGSESPALDVEVMEMAVALFARLGLKDAALEINSVGHSGCRPAYRDALRAALAPHRAALCPDCQRRLDQNPLRILDCKVPGCAELVRGAPVILDFLCDDCRTHLAGVRDGLELLGVDHRVNPRLVRGLDYYTRTTFEAVSGALGAQNALCGGGRYDDLVESMGGDPTPGIGFAIGTDRLVLAVQAAGGPVGRAPADVYIVHLGPAALRAAMSLAARLRRSGLAVRLDPSDRDVKKQMARASTWGAAHAILIGDRELERGVVTLKRMSDGGQRELPSGDWESLVKELRDGGGR